MGDVGVAMSFSPAGRTKGSPAGLHVEVVRWVFAGPLLDFDLSEYREYVGLGGDGGTHSFLFEKFNPLHPFTPLTKWMVWRKRC